MASYLACLLAFFRRKKSYESLLLYSLYGFVGYYIFNTGVHENHLFMPAILGVLLLEFGRRRIFSGLYWAFALNLNLFVFYGWDGREIDYLSLPVTLLIAGVNSAAYLVALSGVLREGGSGSTRSSSRSTPS